MRRTRARSSSRSSTLVKVERRATVRYYTRMHPERLFPLLVVLSRAAIQKVVKKAVEQAESAGTSTLDEWRADQRSFYDGCRDETAVLLGEPGWRLTDDEPMTIVWFRLIENSVVAQPDSE